MADGLEPGGGANDRASSAGSVAGDVADGGMTRASATAEQPEARAAAEPRRDPLWTSGSKAPIVPVQVATDLTGVLTLKHEDRFLLTDAFGDIHGDSRGLGLYHGDTRVLSRYELRFNGQRPVILRTGTGTYAGALQLTNPDFLRNPEDKRDAEVVLRRQSLGILRERLIAEGFRELVRVDNFTLHPERCRISIRLEADFADIFEVRGFSRGREGSHLEKRVSDSVVTFGYVGIDGVLRQTHVSFSEPIVALGDGGYEIDWTIPPGEERRLEVRAWDEIGESAVRPDAPRSEQPETGPVPRQVEASEWASQVSLQSSSQSGDGAPLILEDGPATAHRTWLAGSAMVTTGDDTTNRALRRSLADLRLLVNPGPAAGERYVAAGVPWFTCLFGRDSIITSLEMLAIRPQLAYETLDLLARLQATEVDDWRDAQPGKILHELRSGELARAGDIPQSPYFGTVDATPLWLILLGETFSWTGDRALVDRLWPNALAALRWIEEYGDIDGDGFVEYERRSPRGLINQGWKDSVESNRSRDGRLATAPLALVEVQGYVFAARQAIARLARMRGDDELAGKQEAAAERLRQRFEDAFWMEDVGTYALALDRDKRQVDAIGSNPGHALWTGIVSPERAVRVAATFESPGLWSGWGIRTLSRQMAGYNPIGYHLGTVWPHDNAIVAAGLARYGFRDQAARIAAAMLESTRYFRDARLPELFCGFGRAESPNPVPYPVACSPQAWAAGALFWFVATMLGLRPNADARILELVSPDVPEWLRSVQIENLRIGDAVLDLDFRRTNGSTAVDILRRVGDLGVVVRF